MARRSPMEKRTPVRTISSVMRGDQRQTARPAPSRVVTTPGKKPVTVTTKPAVSSVIRPASPAVKTTGVGTTTTTPTAPVAPVTSTTTKPTTPVTSTVTKPAVAPVSSTGTKPSVTPTKPNTSSTAGGITSTILGGAAGVASKALIDKLLGKSTATTPTPPTPPAGGATKPAATPPAVRPPTTTPPAATTPATPSPTTPTNIPSVPLNAEKQADGTYIVRNDDGTADYYDKNGAYVSTTSPVADSAPITGTPIDDVPQVKPKSGGQTSDQPIDTSGLGSADEVYTDASGNMYDSGGNLLYAFNNGKYYSPDGALLYDPSADEASAGDSNVSYEDNTYVDPETGTVWNWDGSNWTTTEAAPVQEESFPVEAPTQVQEEQPVDDTFWDFADGGFVTLMKNGGSVPHFADGDLVTPVDDQYYDFTPRATATPMATMATSNDFYAIDSQDNGDGTYTIYFSDGSEETFDNPDAAQAAIEAAPPKSTPAPAQWPSGYVSNGDGTATAVMDDGSTITMDENGNVVNATDTGGTSTVIRPKTAVPSVSSAARQTAAPAPNTGSLPKDSNQQNILEKLYEQIGGSKGVAAGAAGALLANMIASGQFGGGSTSGATPDDIGKMTQFAPRTTSFGPGMAGGRTGTGSTVVDYANYGQPNTNEYVPDERLLSDLGVSGYLNEPDMTDYVDAEGNAVDEYGAALNTPEEPQMADGGSTTHYTFGRVIDPAQNLGLAGGGMKKGGLSQAHTLHSHDTNPVVQGRIDFRHGSSVNGPGDGQSDDIPAMLADGEYVMDAELVAMLGNGSNKAGAKILDKFREEVRAHKRGTDLKKIPPKAKSPLAYLKEAMNG